MFKNKAQSVFSANYWLQTCMEIKNVRNLVIAGLCVGLATVISAFYIPVGLNLRVYFTFLVVAFGSMIFGPTVGLITGLAYDLVSYMLFPSGVFFPGYTLSTMLEFFIYGLFLYRSRISIFRVSMMKLIVNYGVHVGLGSLWSAILYKKGYLYFFAKSLIKNTLMLPIEVIMILIMLQIFIPVLSARGLISKQNQGKIPLF